MKALGKLIPFIVVGAVAVLMAQGRGTPNQLRVLVDNNGALVTAGAAQSGSTTAVTMSNARLATDANGALVTTMGSTGQQLFADGTSGAPSIGFASETGLGFYKAATGYIGIANDNASTPPVTFGPTGINVGSGIALSWNSAAAASAGLGDTTLARGGAAGKVVLAGTTPMLQFGGTTNSFPALKQVSTGLYVRSADDSGYGILGSGQYQLGGNTAFSTNVPTISSGFGTSPAILSSNGNVTFRVNVGTGGVATSGVVAMGITVSTGWNCQVTDMTTNIVTRQTANTTTTVTVTAASAWTASDTLIFNCMGF
jgi:hypothetical protein